MTATVEFVGQGTSVTKKLTYDATQTGSFQKVCVGSGTAALKNYSVYNKSPNTGPALLVFEDIATY
jgi:hypothetical protein